MSWFTNKYGNAVNTDWLDEEYKLKYTQIDNNKKQADMLNKSMIHKVSDGETANLGKRVSNIIKKGDLNEMQNELARLRSLEIGHSEAGNIKEADRLRPHVQKLEKAVSSHKRHNWKPES